MSKYLTLKQGPSKMIRAHLRDLSNTNKDKRIIDDIKVIYSTEDVHIIVLQLLTVRYNKEPFHVGYAECLALEELLHWNQNLKTLNRLLVNAISI